MSDRLPNRIPALDLVRSGAELVGSVDLAAMPRLAEALLDDTGQIAVELRFGTDDGVRYVAGRIRGQLRLQCQRCLEPMDLAMDIDVRLGLVEGAQEAERLPEPYEPLVMDDHEIALTQVVEDELLLALPIVPMHTDPGECRLIETDGAPVETARENPFAVLAELKHRS